MQSKTANMKRLFLGVVLAALIVSPTAFAITVTLEGNNSVVGGYNGYNPYQTKIKNKYITYLNI